MKMIVWSRPRRSWRRGRMVRLRRPLSARPVEVWLCSFAMQAACGQITCHWATFSFFIMRKPSANKLWLWRSVKWKSIYPSIFYPTFFLLQLNLTYMKRILSWSQSKISLLRLRRESGANCILYGSRIGDFLILEGWCPFWEKVTRAWPLHSCWYQALGTG